MKEFELSTPSFFRERGIVFPVRVPIVGERQSDRYAQLRFMLCRYLTCEVRIHFCRTQDKN